MLDDAQKEQLLRIRALVKSHFSELFGGKAPFRFFEEHPKTVAPAASTEGLRMIYSYCGLYATA
ncbi:MAG: hypothetical protein IKZ16_03895, partial [Clostridia bacterium]|nr:hypothetical protein [Clostridia bacterium]